MEVRQQAKMLRENIPLYVKIKKKTKKKKTADKSVKWRLKIYHEKPNTTFQNKLRKFYQRCPWCNGYRRREINTATRVQILDETDSISHSTNTLGKGMNPIILPPAMGK